MIQDILSFILNSRFGRVIVDCVWEEKLSGTFNFNKQDDIDSTKFSKPTMKPEKLTLLKTKHEKFRSKILHCKLYSFWFTNTIPDNTTVSTQYYT